MLLWSEETGEGQIGRVAVIAGKRLGNAPNRNRAKRKLREAARLNGAPWKGQQAILVARETCCDAKLAEICQDIEKALDCVNAKTRGEK